MKETNESVSVLTKWSRKIVPTRLQLVVICLAGLIFQLSFTFAAWYVVNDEDVFHSRDELNKMEC
jgi:hypothetical protein